MPIKEGKFSKNEVSEKEELGEGQIEQAAESINGEVISAVLEKLKEGTSELPVKEARARMRDYKQELENIYSDKSREEMINQSAYPVESLYRYFLSVSGMTPPDNNEETPRERMERHTLREVKHNLREKAVAEGKNFRGLPQKLESHKKLYKASKDMVESTENPPEALEKYHEFLKESGSLRDVKKTKDNTMAAAERQETISGLLDKVLDKEMGLMRRSAEQPEEKGFFGRLVLGVKSFFGKEEADFGARVIKRREELRREIYAAYNSDTERIVRSADSVAELEKIWKEGHQSQSEATE